MLRELVVLCMVFFATPIIVIADEISDAPSRYLAAEAQREIQDGFKQATEELKAYQDENFMALDNQMRSVMQNAIQKLVIGALGAMLVGGALVALLMYKVSKRYSLKDYEDRVRQLEQSQQQMAQTQWVTPQQQTFSGEYGQSAASNASVFNNWQVQSPHRGSWEWDGNSGGGVRK